MTGGPGRAPAGDAGFAVQQAVQLRFVQQEHGVAVPATAGLQPRGLGFLAAPDQTEDRGVDGGGASPRTRAHVSARLRVLAGVAA
jgi:hypothetical protein